MVDVLSRMREHGFSLRAGGRKALKALGLLAVLWLLALPVPFLAHAISYVPLLMTALAIASSYVALHVTAQSLHVDEAALEGTCTRGESVVVDVALVNRSPLPIARAELFFSISDPFGGVDVESSIGVALGPREDTSLLFDAVFAHVGNYSCGVDRVVVHDFFGLFSRTVGVPSSARVVVRPRLFDVGDPDLAHVVQEESSALFRPIASDDTDYAGVREYMLGDPMKTVHWNLSARDPQGRLYTRLFEVQAEPGLAVIVDPCSPAYGSEELMGVFDALVESTASICAEACRQGVDAEVRYLDSGGAPASMHLSGTTTAEDLVGTMRAVSPDDTARGEAALLLSAEARSSRGRGNVAFCTSAPDDESLEMLVSMKMRQRNPMLFFALPRTLDDRERQEAKRPLARLAAAGVPYYIVDSNEVETGVRAS